MNQLFELLNILRLHGAPDFHISVFHNASMHKIKHREEISFLNHRHRNIQMQTQHDSVAIQAF